MFTINILSSSDIFLLTKVPDDVFDNPVDEKFAREFLEDPRHHIVVALDDGAIIGFASAVHYIHPDKAPELFINEVGVSPAHHNKGVGKAILKELLHLGRSLGCVNAWVLTDRSNAAANGLYRSVGGKAENSDLVLYEFDTTEEQGGLGI